MGMTLSSLPRHGLNAPAGTTLSSLPNEILLLIVDYLDSPSVSRFRCTNRRFKYLVDVCHQARIQMQWAKINYYVENLLRITQEFYDVPTLIQDETVLKHFLTTLSTMASHIQSRLMSPIVSETYHRLCDHLVNRFALAHRMLVHLLHGTTDRSKLGVTVEMLDFYIRSEIQEFEAMFPHPLYIGDPSSWKEIRRRSSYELHSIAEPIPRPVSTPLESSELIDDPTARKMWMDSFDTVLPDFHTFYHDLLLRYWPNFENNLQLKDGLFAFFDRHLICQEGWNPSRWMDLGSICQDYITPYKWNILVNNFGPCEILVENFLQYGCEPIFLGAVNLMSVESLLKSLPTDEISYRLRISRTHPELLTLSYRRAGRSQIRHRRKPPHVPLRDFLESLN